MKQFAKDALMIAAVAVWLAWDFLKVFCHVFHNGRSAEEQMRGPH